jgi:hypothetical protein
MSTLIFIATTIIKPALIAITIISCVIAAYILTRTTNKGNKAMNQNITTRQARAMIKAIGRQKTAQLLAAKGLTLKDVGIM